MTIIGPDPDDNSWRAQLAALWEDFKDNRVAQAVTLAIVTMVGIAIAVLVTVTRHPEPVTVATPKVAVQAPAPTTTTPKSPTAPVATPAPAPVAPPAVPTATVHKDSTLWGIAQRQCGNGSRWTEIQSLNSNVDPGKLEVDQVLKLPDDCKSESAPVSGPAASTSQASTAAPTARVLISGTLWGISSRLCDDGYRWTEIQALNGNLDPKKLRLNQKLTLPADCKSDPRSVPSTHPLIADRTRPVKPTSVNVTTVTEPKATENETAGYVVPVQAPCGATVKVNCSVTEGTR